MARAHDGQRRERRSPYRQPPRDRRGAALARGVAVSAAAIVVAAAPAGAHTEPDVVAVPAGEAAQVTLQPTHGCGESPTVEVAARVPVADARAGEVPGWSSEATQEEDATVLEWTGGVLPADEVGAFTVQFTASDQPGELLTFPFVQICEDGTELAWIDGDPEGEYPAPRLLVLPAGSAPAATIDDVPADAPGRDQLVEIVDVDNPSATTTTSSTTTTTSTTSTAPTETSTTASADTPAEGAAPEADDGADDDALPIVLAIGGAVLAAALFALALRRRRGSADRRS